MAVSRDDLAALEVGPERVLDLLVGEVRAVLLLHVEDEAEHLLVRKTVEGSGETSERGRVGEEGVLERGSDQVCRRW